MKDKEATPAPLPTTTSAVSTTTTATSTKSKKKKETTKTKKRKHVGTSKNPNDPDGRISDAITNHSVGGHLRIGWSMRTGELQAPVGYDRWSYGYRDINGSKVHNSRREDRWGGEAFGP